MTKKEITRNIGLNVKPPNDTCADINCPFHGKLPVRGQTINGIVMSDKQQGTITVKKEFMHYVKKFERYEKRTALYSAHSPPCLQIKTGDTVRIAECRPLSKTISFVAIENIKTE